MTLTAAIYNDSNFPSTMVPSALENEGGGGGPLLPRGSLKECDVLLKREGAMKAGGGKRDSLKAANQSLVRIKPHSCCEHPGDRACPARPGSE